MKFYFAVEYIENGVRCSDDWSERTLIDEIKKGEVEIISISPSVPQYINGYKEEFLKYIDEIS